MEWKDKPIGVVLSGSQQADFAALKAEGVRFAFLRAGQGFDYREPHLAAQVQAAHDAGIPVQLIYTPFPAVDDYTQEDLPGAQLENALACTANKRYYGYVLSIERWWTGMDYEEWQAGKRPLSEIRKATDSNISTCAKWLADVVSGVVDDSGHKFLCRTSDSFVGKYSPSLQNWLGNYAFDVVDYRCRFDVWDADSGTWKEQTRNVVSIPGNVPVENARTVADLLAVGAKNPLIPGKDTALKFWEFTGDRIEHPAITDIVTGAVSPSAWALFNGTEAELNAYLGFAVQVPGEEPEQPEQPGVGEPDWFDKVVLLFRALAVGADAAADWLDEVGESRG